MISRPCPGLGLPSVYGPYENPAVDAINVELNCEGALSVGQFNNPFDEIYNVAWDSDGSAPFAVAKLGEGTFSNNAWDRPSQSDTLLHIGDERTYADFELVPIPAAVWLLGGGLIGLLGLRKRFKN